MKKLYLFTIYMSFSGALLAVEVPKSEITYIAPWATHIDIRVDADGLDPENCGLNDLYRIDLINDQGAEAKFSVILASYISGKAVVLSIGGCVGDRPKIAGVRLY